MRGGMSDQGQDLGDLRPLNRTQDLRPLTEWCRVGTEIIPTGGGGRPPGVSSRRTHCPLRSLGHMEGGLGLENHVQAPILP